MEVTRRACEGQVLRHPSSRLGRRLSAFSGDHDASQPARVFHAASLVVVSYEDGKNAQAKLVDPIVKGAGNVLRSCAKATSPPRRVVFTSSSSSCVCYSHHHGHGGAAAPSSLNESHWNDVEYCRTYGLWYAYAKTVVERDAWRLAKQHGLDLVVVNTPFVVRPMLALTAPTSTALVVLAMLRGELGKYPRTPPSGSCTWKTWCSPMSWPWRMAGRLICSGDVAHWSEVFAFSGSRPADGAREVRHTAGTRSAPCSAKLRPATASRPVRGTCTTPPAAGDSARSGSRSL